MAGAQHVNENVPSGAFRASPSGPAAEERKRVVVAMSGGVDSSVVAALMRDQGHDVIGITLQLYDHGAATGRKGSCCAGQDIHDARRVADALGIPHYVLNYERRFSAAVIDSFAESYAAGETPIPCVACNQQIKFRDLLETAKDLGADALATGHYIQRREGPNGPELVRAVDADRDQSYFLFTTTQEQLDFLWFPLGGLPKAEVRELARRYNLTVAEKADSQDICFVPTGRYTGIVERLKPGAVKPGDIVHADGRKLGTHSGIINFTVGQRKGLGITGPEPLYVIRLDADTNEVVVGPRDCLRTQSLLLRNVNWLGDAPLAEVAAEGLPIFARVRSTQPPQAARLFADADGAVTVVLEDGEDGVAVGQACVFYTSGDNRGRLLGGGFIAKTVAKQVEAARAPELSRAGLDG
ncbi:tRNA 2-thiouridine(34) synthase MnmA [Hyphomicrobium sulfonivorans]|uniref:tRNA 2-thiouridine(34) synthase MnmA n=1 Tax=Hyphomicrobium sulfonivorans TaxID=121290 RepID=UPI00156F9241|nr:tRNA 2-thiouridine(34) synthase MnmA [Hyphomicrobium sulfonivorans]MBI1649826.1 tRNA 2-thiouridine(34) synthase MnmA [Hyphomicrobium sulfonivorans]NSL71741.1 tRNA 2-thiouridine(34) synthase MnmA [Hyphomicrobium sulfonivorans]